MDLYSSFPLCLLLGGEVTAGKKLYTLKVYTMNQFRRISVEEAQFHIPLAPGESSRAVAYTLTPSKEPEYEGWEDVTYYGESIFDASGAIRNPEWVYVLVNRSVPGICKIGMTTTSVRQRVAEINSATGVITPWFPVYSYKCVNSRLLEQEVHSSLEKSGHRINPRREGFECTTNDAIRIIEELGWKYQAPKFDSPHEYDSYMDLPSDPQN